MIFNINNIKKDEELFVLENDSQIIFNKTDKKIEILNHDNQYIEHCKTSIFNEPIKLLIWSVNDIAILYDRFNEDVYKINCYQGTLKKIYNLSRKREIDRAFIQEQFYEYNGGALLVYESGMLNFSDIGELVWTNKQIQLNWKFCKIEDQMIFYENLYGGIEVFNFISGEKIKDNNESKR